MFHKSSSKIQFKEFIKSLHDIVLSTVRMCGGVKRISPNKCTLSRLYSYYNRSCAVMSSLSLSLTQVLFSLVIVFPVLCVGDTMLDSIQSRMNYVSKFFPLNRQSVELLTTFSFPSLNNRSFFKFWVHRHLKGIDWHFLVCSFFKFLSFFLDFRCVL